VAGAASRALRLGLGRNNGVAPVHIDTGLADSQGACVKVDVRRAQPGDVIEKLRHLVRRPNVITDVPPRVSQRITFSPSIIRHD
jgi:hypothetical protein